MHIFKGAFVVAMLFVGFKVGVDLATKYLPVSSPTPAVAS